MRRYLMLLAGLLGASVLAAQEAGGNQQTQLMLQQYQKLFKVYRDVAALYVDEVDMAPLVESAITAMLEELDPHSAYIGAEEMEDVQASFDGEFSGIGVEFSLLRDTIVVANTIAGGPSEQVGVLPNDRIVRIDTLDAVGMRMADVPRYLRGPRGTKVAVEVVRHGVPGRLHFVITRDRIPLNTVDASYMAAEGIGYIKINRFGRTTMSEFMEAYRDLGRCKGLILDLRGNGGGLLQQAILLAEFFLPGGSAIVSTEGRAVSPTRFEARGGEKYRGNLVVLIDESSASASEIVSGAVQDWDRGVIVGRQSFGKGLVQRQIPLGDGSTVRITVARYHTPSGRVIQRPYENGNRREYYLDHLRRYDDRVRDSLDAGAPLYETLRTHRTVRGGGGIAPDVVVREDTTGYTNYYAELVRRGGVNEYALSGLDARREELKRLYPDFAAFAAGFEPSQQMLDELVTLGCERGVAYNDSEYLESESFMRLQLKALLGQRLYGNGAFYRVMNEGRTGSYSEAVEILRNWESRGRLLLDIRN